MTRWAAGPSRRTPARTAGAVIAAVALLAATFAAGFAVGSRTARDGVVPAVAGPTADDGGAPTTAAGSPPAPSTGGTPSTGAASSSTVAPSSGASPSAGAAGPPGPRCHLPGDGACGPYAYPRITNSNGFNTYVANQLWGCGTPGSCGPQTLTSHGPGRWTVTSTQRSGGTAVLTYPHVQQLFNDWTGHGFNGTGAATDTPVSALGSLTSTYAESMNENDGTAAQAAYDIWTSSGEIMIWVDTTRLRGVGGADRVAAGTIGGLPFTFYRYGGDKGLPIIKLDTNRKVGTIDILDGLRWMQAKGFVAANATISQVNFGWEICSTGGVAETFELTDYALTATPKR